MTDPRPYPVLTCASCGHPTGWLGSGDRCATCLEPEARRALFEAGVLVAPPRDAPELPTPRGPLLSRSAAALGVRKAAAREAARQWLAWVDPGRTGPAEPVEGFEIEAPTRSEGRAPEGPDLLVRFQSLSIRFDGGRWVQIPGRRVGKPRLATPSILPASLPMEQLAEAWADFRAEIDAFNCAAWAEESARLAAAETDAAAAREARLQQHGTSDLLG